MKCEANAPFCILLHLLGTDELHSRPDPPLRGVVIRALRPRDSTDTGLSTWVVILIIVLSLKLIAFGYIMWRCSQRRSRRRLGQEVSSQSNGSHKGLRPEKSNVNPTVVSPVLQCTGQHAAGVSCHLCRGATIVDRSGVISEATTTKHKSSDKPRCHNIHLPWRKCPTCHVDPPRSGHIELDSEPLPPGPHEMSAHVPTWQAQPTHRVENYGGFYVPEPQAPPLPPRPASTAWRRSVVTPHLVVVGNGHKSYASYQAASGQPTYSHVRTRSVSPVAEERSPVSRESEDLLEAARELYRKNKSGERLLSRYVGT